MKHKILFVITILILWITSFNISNAQNCIQCDENCVPSGTYSSVMGMSSTATSDMALAGGFNSHANGAFSFAYGNQVLTNGANSFAFGRFVEATATSAIIFGTGYDLNNKLTNNTTSSFMIGFNSDVPTFFIKGKVGLNSTGRIGIGNVTSPQAKLHIREDDNYDTASVFIQASNIERPAYLWLGTKNYGLQKQNTSLEFLTDGDYVFSQGNIKLDNHYLIEATRIQSNTSYGLSLFTSYNSGIFIDERGQVGIGNTRPNATLDITGKIKAAYLQIPGTNPKDSLRDLTNYVLKSRDNYGNVTWAPQSSLDDGDWSINASDELFFNGNVGIGIDDPIEKLQVAGDVKVDGTINFTGQLLHDDQPFQTSQWETSGNDIFFDSGNVGIGTELPEYPLHIVSPVENYHCGTETFMRIEDGADNNPGDILGYIEFGRLGSSGSFFKQRCGLCFDGESGPVIKYVQQSSGGDIGLTIETTTNWDGHIQSSHIFGAEDLQISSEDGIITLGSTINNGLTINQDGQIGIGTTIHEQSSRFTVAGLIHAQEVKVTATAGGADFVFDGEYDLPRIDEVAEFVTTNKHLPDIPSAKQMQEDGVDIGELQIKLLQKIEELTLYVIDLKKENEAMRQRIDELEK